MAFRVSFLSRTATADDIAVDGVSFAQAKRAAARECRALGATFSAFLLDDESGEALATYDGHRWSTLYSAAFLARRYGVAA